MYRNFIVLFALAVVLVLPSVVSAAGPLSVLSGQELTINDTQTYTTLDIVGGTLIIDPGATVIFEERSIVDGEGSEFKQIQPRFAGTAVLKHIMLIHQIHFRYNISVKFAVTSITTRPYTHTTPEATAALSVSAGTKFSKPVQKILPRWERKCLTIHVDIL